MFRWLLLPFAFLYGFVVWIRNRLFDSHILTSKEFSTPVIVVGNITVGGTGKTPHVEYLIKLLRGEKKVAVLSRGYKRKSKGFIVADIDTTSVIIGDESRQIKRKFPDVTVAVDENRSHGITKLLKGAAGVNPDVVVLDDAFQHRYVKPGLSILLVDYNRPLEKDYILPYGRLRESVSEKKRANILIVTKSPYDLKPIDRRIIRTNMNLFPYQSLFFTYLKYGALKSVFFDNSAFSPEQLEDEKLEVLLVSGIANPTTLIEYLESKYNRVEHLKFPDHHSFTGKDVARIDKMFNAMAGDNTIIVTTEKDAVRMSDNSVFEPLASILYYVPIEICFIDNDGEKFQEIVNSFISNCKKIEGLNRTL